MTVVSVIVEPTHQKQMNSADKYGKYNCSAYAFAMYVHAATLRAIKVSGRWVRENSDEPIPDTNPATANGPGLNHHQLVKVAAKLHILLQDKDGGSWDDMVRLLPLITKPTDDFTHEHRVCASVWYASLGVHRCQMGGTDFGHELLLTQRRMRAGVWEIFGHDPLCGGGKWYPASVIKGAMEEWGRRTGTTIRYATGAAVPRMARRRV